MKVLVACEFSGVVRQAFCALGHDTYSCDLLPAEDVSSDGLLENGVHLQCDVRKLLSAYWKWDLMIAFPPCTHLAVSGARWFKDKVKEQADAITFVERLWDAKIRRIAIENPISVLSTRSKLGKPTQIIQPYEFGHPESKKTCLWLKQLPPLQPTHILPLPERGYWDNQTPSGQNKLGPSVDREKNRSRTYVGIAQAMAEQWGSC